MNPHALRLAAALVAVGAAGCSPVDNRPAEWAYISPAILQPNCATTSCHSPAAAVAGLDFSTPDNGYTSLTQLAVYELDGGVLVPPECATRLAADPGQVVCDTRPLVTAYDPDGSRLVNMLLARDAPRMPPDRPLTMPDIQLIERWILNGAFEYPGGKPPADAGSTTRLDAQDGPPADGAGPKNDGPAD